MVAWYAISERYGGVTFGAGSNVFHREAQRLLKEGKVDVLNSRKLRLFFIFDLFKLLRLPRIKPLMASSEFVLRSWEQMNVEVALTVKFIFMITVVSHWIACTWGFIAYMEAGSFDSSMLDDINWISNWYKTSYVEGGLNPIGWRNALPRYWLCLFWAIQSITSIGYGTIAPVTNAEYICANILMLLCGIFWAYVIGNLVEVVTSMGSINREYSTRMQEANQMMREFTAKDLPESMSNGTSKKRIRRFLTDQQHAARRNNMLLSNNACAFHDAYPTLSILSPELERLSALHLAHPLLETIPYLSSKYLSPEEQAIVALQCVTMEFSALERFVKHPNLGRGLLIFRRGYGIASRFPVSTIERCLSYEDLIGHCLDVDEVLVDNDHCSELRLVYHFVGYTKVLFVPRTVIMSVLETNARAWKECARWRYFMAAFILYSLDYAKKRTEDYQC
ncbi:hypothetical protein ACHAWU_006478 [Discostella pseudostelligera]|uniref:Potassium channel domain-containing protein n=1 Tax=Discostella pseudostelligera TaxID=259834 RepID=A0ABD3N7V5_9STRA